MHDEALVRRLREKSKVYKSLRRGTSESELLLIDAANEIERLSREQKPPMEEAFIPTTRQVREGYAHDPEVEYRNPDGYSQEFEANKRAFDRWFNKLKETVAAEAVREYRENSRPDFSDMDV